MRNFGLTDKGGEIPVAGKSREVLLLLLSIDPGPADAV